MSIVKDYGHLTHQVLVNTRLFWILALIFAVTPLLEFPFNNTLSQYVDLRSEYTFSEQLSKILLLSIIQLSFIGYLLGRYPGKVSLSISFLLLGLCFYLAESNMIAEDVQPFFGLVLIGTVIGFAYRMRAWSCILFVIAASAFIAFGSIIDQLSEPQSWQGHSWAQFLSVSIEYIGLKEERFDVLGIATLFVASLSVFSEELRIIFSRKEYLLVPFGIALLAIGNGFLHYEYKPSDKLYLLGLGLSLVGFFLLSFSARHAIYIENSQKVNTVVIFSFLFVFFIILPATFSGLNEIRSLSLWVPTFLLIGWRLQQLHSCSRSNPT